MNATDTYLQPGDLIPYAGQICRIVSVNDCAAVVAVPQPARSFWTIFGKHVRLQPGPKLERISPNSCVPILNRKA